MNPQQQMQQQQQPQQQQQRTNADGLKVDVEDPDLYVPLMAYVTYVLLYGLTRGASGTFTPDLLASTATFAMVLLVLEVMVAKLGCYLSGAAVISMLDLFANCGYKYVSLA